MVMVTKMETKGKMETEMEQKPKTKKSFIKLLRAENLKLKRSGILFAHILIPLITCVIFLLYYSFSPWGEKTKLIAFYQAIGIGLPVLIGIFAASVMEQEQMAGNFYNLLTVPKKTAAFLSKLFLLLLLEWSALLLTAVFFGGARGCITLCVMASFIMWASSIPLYLWQMFLAFQFGKGASIANGLLSGLVSALFLTKMGEYVWKFVFFSWTGRAPSMYLESIVEENLSWKTDFCSIHAWQGNYANNGGFLQKGSFTNSGSSL